MARTILATTPRVGMVPERADPAGNDTSETSELGPVSSQPALLSPEVRFGHVLVPLDGSSFSLAAMETAQVLAERFDAELQTIGVASRDAEAGPLLKIGAAAIGADDAESRAVVVTGGDPAAMIARRADELGSCLVCLSTHGRGRFTGALLGSVARSVLQRSGGAIVALGPMAHGPGWTPRPRSWPEPLSNRRIVACVDGSEESEEVLPSASGWARALGMSLTILTVIEDAPERITNHSRASRYGAHGDVQLYIQGLTQRWRGSARDVNGVVLRDPIGPASGIRHYLAQQPAGLVAVRTHARSGLRRVLSGATAAKIIRASIAPCLVVAK
jgi:nucleotide-binding universal stress UspA family protein